MHMYELKKFVLFNCDPLKPFPPHLMLYCVYLYKIFVCTCSRLRHSPICRALECDLISQGCDKKKTLVALVRPAIRENKTKVSATQKVSLLFDNRHVSLISWSKPIRDSEGRTPPPLIGRGPDIPACMCAFEDACAAAVKQRERLVVEMHAALSLNLLYSVNVWQSLQDYAIAEFIAKSSKLRYFPNCRRFCA